MASALLGDRHASRDCPVRQLHKFSLYESNPDEALAEREPGMLSLPHLMTTLMLAGGMSLWNGVAAPAETRVDLALVLAIDVSFSMEPDEQGLQRHGFAEAFQSPEVHWAIRQGVQGRIAVVYVEWSGVFDQRIIVSWTVIEQPADGLAFTERLFRSPIHRMSYTSISRGHRLQRPAASPKRRAGGSAGDRHLG
jgi:hypothetical protein